jgi:hypothetical protein
MTALCRQPAVRDLVPHGERLWQTLEISATIAKIGATGLRRLATARRRCR